ncbi:hypothetical protein F5Y09DRAFT_77066 [Xylaria sp. FL1042]|nr:hypothetical protein F5Y09DRAFT_77066 [Xylaria sp. FL1042]
MSRHSWLGKALLAGWLAGVVTNWSQTGTSAAFLIAAPVRAVLETKISGASFECVQPTAKIGRLQQASLLKDRLSCTRGLEKGKSGKLQSSRTVVGYYKDEIVLYKASPGN